MTLRINKEAGKGSNRRATQNDSAYRSNYDAIFGKKIKEEPRNISDEKQEEIEIDVTIASSDVTKD
jgi:hypothetical protein